MSLPHGLLRRSINQRVSLSIHRAFHGKEFSRFENGSPDPNPGISFSGVASGRADAPSSAGESAVTISSISMVFGSGKVEEGWS